LQSVSLGHREALTVSASPRFPGGSTHAPSTGRLRDNVVTAMTFFNKLLPPLPCPPLFRRSDEQPTWKAAASDLRRTL